MIASPLRRLRDDAGCRHPIDLPGARVPPLPASVGAAHTMRRTSHTTLASCFLAVILLHVAAGFFRALVRRDGVFEALSLGPGDSFRHFPQANSRRAP